MGREHCISVGLMISAFIDYYQAVSAHSQKASEHSFAYTGNVENVELWARSTKVALALG